MKVFLGNPPWRKGNRLGVRAGSRWPFTMLMKEGRKVPDYLPFPFLLAYATAVLEKNDIPVMLVDGIAEGMTNEQFVDKVKKYNPDLIVIETSTPSIDIDLTIAKKIKCELPHSKICLCGPHVSIFSKETLEENPFVDYVLIGEYEYTLLDLVKHLEGRQSLKDVFGLAYRTKNGIKVNPRRPPIQNLDELPWPARHFLPMRNYKDSFCSIPLPSLQMWASRGCPYRCIFCLWPQVMYGGHTYRVRNPVDVVDEMEWCIKEYGFKSVYFDDDTVNIGKLRMLKLAGEIKRRNLDIPWAIMARADTMDKEILEKMADSGLYAVKYGVESGSQKIINRSGKNLDLKKVKEIVKLTKQIGIKVHLTFMFGLPGETKETVKTTIKFVEELDPDSVQFSICTPFPGTKYYEMAKKKGFLYARSWAEFDGATTAVIRTEELSKEDLEKVLCFAEKSWARHQIIKNLKTWKYIWKGIKHPLRTIKYISKIV